MNKLIRNNFDILIITEGKYSQYQIPGYRLFRNDRHNNGGGLMCCINQDLPVKIVTSYTFPIVLEVLPGEIMLGKR